MQDSHEEREYIDNQAFISLQLPLGFHQAYLRSQTWSHVESNQSVKREQTKERSGLKAKQIKENQRKKKTK